MVIASAVWGATVTVATPDLVVSSADVAVIAAVPEVDGVNTPEEVIAPSVAVQVTAELYAAVPCTLAVQVDVCVVRMDAGAQATETEVTVTGMATATVAEPDLVLSWVDVAVIVTVPEPAGVKTPVVLTVPMFAGLTDHATEEL
jgi:hypothetical protein